MNHLERECRKIQQNVAKLRIKQCLSSEFFFLCATLNINYDGDDDENGDDDNADDNDGSYGDNDDNETMFL